jgi:hypothetical protein
MRRALSSGALFSIPYSSRMLSSPLGFLAMRSMTCWLSWYEIVDQFKPSLSYSSCSLTKTCSLNCCWSLSFAKLMLSAGRVGEGGRGQRVKERGSYQSCSKEFFPKISKPKMSRMPMNLIAAVFCRRCISTSAARECRLPGWILAW